MRRLTLVAAVCLSLVAAACSKGSPPAALGPKPQKGACPDKIPFVATYLPRGFSNQIQSGPAQGKTTVKNATINHYTGQGGEYLEFLRGGKRARLSGSKGIIVLNHLARIGPIPAGWAINVHIATQRCAGYQIVLGGFPAAAKPGDELVKIGHALKALPSST